MNQTFSVEVTNPAWSRPVRISDVKASTTLEELRKKLAERATGSVFLRNNAEIPTQDESTQTIADIVPTKPDGKSKDLGKVTMGSAMTQVSVQVQGYKAHLSTQVGEMPRSASLSALRAKLGDKYEGFQFLNNHGIPITPATESSTTLESLMTAKSHKDLVISMKDPTKKDKPIKPVQAPEVKDGQFSKEGVKGADEKDLLKSKSATELAQKAVDVKDALQKISSDKWAEIFQNCNLGKAWFMDGDKPRQSPKPAVVLMPNQVPYAGRIPTGTISSKAVATTQSRAYLREGFTEAEAKLAVTAWVVGAAGSAKGKQEQSSQSAEASRRLYLQASWEMPSAFVTLDVDDRRLSLSPDFLADFDRAIGRYSPDQGYKHDASDTRGPQQRLQALHALLHDPIKGYGARYSQRCELGARLYKETVEEATDAHSAATAKDRLAAAMKLDVDTWVTQVKSEATVKLGAREESKSESHTQHQSHVFQSVGGIKQLINQPGKWLESSAKPETWAVINRDQSRELFDLLDEARALALKELQQEVANLQVINDPAGRHHDRKAQHKIDVKPTMLDDLSNPYTPRLLGVHRLEDRLLIFSVLRADHQVVHYQWTPADTADTELAVANFMDKPGIWSNVCEFQDAFYMTRIDKDYRCEVWRWQEDKRAVLRNKRDSSDEEAWHWELATDVDVAKPAGEQCPDYLLKGRISRLVKSSAGLELGWWTLSKEGYKTFYFMTSRNGKNWTDDFPHRFVITHHHRGNEPWQSMVYFGQDLYWTFQGMLTGRLEVARVALEKGKFERRKNYVWTGAYERGAEHRELSVAGGAMVLAYSLRGRVYYQSCRQRNGWQKAGISTGLHSHHGALAFDYNGKTYLACVDSAKDAIHVEEIQVD